MEVVCPECDRRFQVPPELIAEEIVCPACGCRFHAPVDPRAVIIEVQAQAEDAPRNTASPPTEVLEVIDESGNRYRRTVRFPGGFYRFESYQGAAPGIGCCGIGCLAVIAIAAYLMLRGFISLF
jgi:uncharacterized Zn finger protein (UPF0148 family)